jgi:23S rRNA-/tRNA-specific pseudouridylate synthase
MKISILYEDNHLLVVEKPMNVPVQEDNSGDPDLLSILKEDIKIRYKKPGNRSSLRSSCWRCARICKNVQGGFKIIGYAS